MVEEGYCFPGSFSWLLCEMGSQTTQNQQSDSSGLFLWFVCRKQSQIFPPYHIMSVLVKWHYDENNGILSIKDLCLVCLLPTQAKVPAYSKTWESVQRPRLMSSLSSQLCLQLNGRNLPVRSQCGNWSLSLWSISCSLSHPQWLPRVDPEAASSHKISSCWWVIHFCEEDALSMLDVAQRKVQIVTCQQSTVTVTITMWEADLCQVMSIWVIMFTSKYFASGGNRRKLGDLDQSLSQYG